MTYDERTRSLAKRLDPKAWFPCASGDIERRLVIASRREKSLREARRRLKDTEPSLDLQRGEIDQNIAKANQIFNEVNLKLKECNPMTAKLLNTVTYIHGNDVKTMTEDELVSTIKRLEKEVDDIDAIKTKSTKLEARKTAIADAIKVVVAELDSRS